MLLAVIVFADVGQKAFAAFWPSGLAYVAAVEDKPVVSFGEFLGRDVFGEGTLGLEGRLGVAGEADAVRDAEDMGVYRHGGLVEDHGGDYVGGLAPHTW